MMSSETNEEGDREHYFKYLWVHAILAHGTYLDYLDHILNY